jgi:hypothetical protein
MKKMTDKEKTQYPKAHLGELIARFFSFLWNKLTK